MNEIANQLFGLTKPTLFMKILKINLFLKIKSPNFIRINRSQLCPNNHPYWYPFIGKVFDSL